MDLREEVLRQLWHDVKREFEDFYEEKILATRMKYEA